jgi:nicotinate-nucleotide adenylyltransferase
VSLSRLGLLGGTFDPVHTGHLQLALASLAEFGLDQVLFIPSASPPHKLGVPITSFAHRLAMLELASRCSPMLACSGIEGKLPGPSYTIDTLHALAGMFPETELYFIIGVDAFLDFATWKSYREILHQVDILIALRDGYNKRQLNDFLQKIGYFWQDNVWRHAQSKKNIFLLKAIPGQFSSTLIRKKIRAGILPQEDVPREVLEYIVDHKLYQACSGETDIARVAD